MNARLATRLAASSLLALLSVVAGQARAQSVCTSVPCASDGSNPACDSLAEIDAKIDAAGPGEVVCLKRGSVWSSASTALSFNTHHSDADRVTVCASDAASCTSGGAANPRITTTSSTANAASWSSTGDGYTLENIDWLNSTGLGVSAFGSFPEGIQDLRLDGGVFSGWLSMAVMWDFGADVPDNLEIGTCANPVEFKDAVSPTSSARYVLFGACTNCSFSMWVHDWGGSAPTNGQIHVLDFSAENGAAESTNVRIECSLFEAKTRALAGNGHVVRLAKGAGVTIRDNTFRILESEPAPPAEAHCAPAIVFAPHIVPPPLWFQYWNGAEIYRNTFDMKNCPGITNAIGSDVNIFNNLFIQDWAPGDAWFFARSLVIEAVPCAGGGGCQVAQRTAFYNNTIYANENGSGADSNPEALVQLGDRPGWSDVAPGPHTLSAELLSPSLEPLANSGSSVQITMATDLDEDSDGFADAIDNCIYQLNAQSDLGGPGTSGPDGIGDGCQCGDLDADGDADLADVAELRRALADPVGDALSVSARAHCSVIGSVGSCDVGDVAALLRANAGLSPGLTQSCEAAQPDLDGDGFADVVDNCMYLGNDQTDAGGAVASGPDGVGDACQCGDLDADGDADLADASVLRLALANPVGAALSSQAKKRCSVVGVAGSCDVLDFAVLVRADAGYPPALGQTCSAAQPDLDKDGFAEASDNCPYLANNQADSGAVGAAGPDGIGDACQCGDLDSDGDADLADVAELRQALADPIGSALSSLARTRCSVIGVAGTCDVLDAALLMRANTGLPPAPEQVCAAARP